jgi:hypothetical protein
MVEQIKAAELKKNEKKEQGKGMNVNVIMLRPAGYFGFN